MPPARLEARITDALRARGVLRPSPRRIPLWHTAALLAASAGAFFLGRLTAPSPATDAVSTPRWMLLLYEDDQFEGPAPGREADYVAEYRRWAQTLGRQGALVDGAELVPGGGWLDSAGAELVESEREVPGAGRITGYFVITAPNADSAAAVAASSPHLLHRGRIAIKPLGAS
ncbi:MAG: hypothetical protein FJ206_13960 [Gemmatimonadetes bacterium]|nr:hypothetical protein [Gemmatimonadota bacterium]